MVAKPRSIPILLPLALFFGQTPVHFLFGAFQDDGVGKGLFSLWLGGALVYFIVRLLALSLLPALAIGLCGGAAFLLLAHTGGEYAMSNFVFLALAFFGIVAATQAQRRLTSPAVRNWITFLADYSLLAVSHPLHGHVCIVDHVAGKRHGAVLDRNQRFKLGRDGPGANRRKHHRALARAMKDKIFAGRKENVAAKGSSRPRRGIANGRRGKIERPASRCPAGAAGTEGAELRGRREFCGTADLEIEMADRRRGHCRRRGGFRDGPGEFRANLERPDDPDAWPGSSTNYLLLKADRRWNRRASANHRRANLRSRFPDGISTMRRSSPPRQRIPGSLVSSSLRGIVLDGERSIAIELSAASPADVEVGVSRIRHGNRQDAWRDPRSADPDAARADRQGEEPNDRDREIERSNWRDRLFTASEDKSKPRPAIFNLISAWNELQDSIQRDTNLKQLAEPTVLHLEAGNYLQGPPQCCSAEGVAPGRTCDASRDGSPDSRH